MPAPNPLLAAALEYARRGWRVVPLHTGFMDGTCSCGKPECGKSAGKHPRWAEGVIERGLLDASTDPAKIAEWWGLWPRANIGVVCGVASGVWMVGPDGQQGIDDLAGLCEANGATLEALLANCAVSKSQGGGRHLIFAWPADGLPIKNRKNHGGTKIDVRSHGDGGGYFVAPPSVGPKGRYEWLSPPPEVPARPFDWLVAWARTDDEKPEPEVRTSAPPPRPGPGRTADQERQRIVAYLDRCPRSVAGQRGHDALFWAARVLVRGFDLSDDEALSYLHTYFNHECKPKWSQKELEHKVREAREKPFSKPVGWLRDSENPLRDHPPPRDFPAGGGDGATAAPADWPEPLSPRRMLPAPPFPLRVFPAYLEDFAASVAELTNVPVGYVAANMLGVAAGAVGATLSLALTDEWTERACLFVAVVAPKSAGKTPAHLATIRPLRRIQAERAKAEDKAVLFTTDTTVEAIAPLLRDRPRGLLVAADELSGFIGGMNQYKPGGKGGDRAFWLSCWAGTPLSVLRRNPEAPHLWVPHPCVSVLGGVQPAVLADVFGTDDGLAERFLYECSDPLPASRATRGKYHQADEWQALVKSLSGLQMEQGEYGTRPFRLRLAEDAWDVFADWTAECGGPADRDQTLDGFRSKAKGYAGRLALVLHAVHSLGGGRSILPVPAATMAAAVDLCRYYLAQVGRVRAGAGAGASDAERVLEWLAKCKQPSVARSDVWRGLRRQFDDPKQLGEPLRRLVLLGWLRYVEPEWAGRGPRPEVRYELRPDLADTWKRMRDLTDG